MLQCLLTADVKDIAATEAEYNSKVLSLGQQVEEKDVLLAKFHQEMKVANYKLSMYRKSDAMSKQLVEQYQHFHSSTQQVLATKFRTKLVRGSHSVVNARTKVKEAEIARMLKTLDELEAHYSPAKHRQNDEGSIKAP